jgi:hypothetical protein
VSRSPTFVLMDGIPGLLRRPGSVEGTGDRANRRGAHWRALPDRSTLPYCDVVVAEAIASHIHRSGLSGRLQAVALAQLSELDRHH